jgi:hypothetical protein
MRKISRGEVLSQAQLAAAPGVGVSVPPGYAERARAANKENGAAAPVLLCDGTLSGGSQRPRPQRGTKAQPWRQQQSKGKGNAKGAKRKGKGKQMTQQPPPPPPAAPGGHTQRRVAVEPPPPPLQATEMGSTQEEQADELPPPTAAVVVDTAGKQLRNVRKLLRQIEGLQASQAAGESLRPGQLTKIRRKAALLAKVAELDPALYEVWERGGGQHGVW